MKEPKTKESHTIKEQEKSACKVACALSPDGKHKIKTVLEGGQHFSHDIGYWDDIREIRICTICGKEIK